MSTIVDLAGQRCLLVDADGAVVRDASGGRDLIEEALGERATVIAVPVERLDPSFFELRSGLAGEVLQKAVNYRMRFAVIGDISSHVAASGALRDFVVESERGSSIFFVADVAGLEARLAQLQAPAG
jgi:hypothetical protein